jgi:hypothetical protein
MALKPFVPSRLPGLRQCRCRETSEKQNQNALHFFCVEFIWIDAFTTSFAIHLQGANDVIPNLRKKNS